MQLTHFDVSAFLSDYWQKKLALIKIPGITGTIQSNRTTSRDCLGGRHRSAPDYAAAREVGGRTRPPAESRFSQLGKKRWTLLVQAVDHYVPEVAELIESFRFIPNWRIDDVMVSYAVDSGGVGPPSRAGSAKYNSTPEYSSADYLPETPIGNADVRGYLAHDVPLSRNPASRFSFVRQEADAILLFVDGQCFKCGGETGALAQQLCAQDRITIDLPLRNSDGATELIATLLNQGSLTFES